MKRLKIRMPSRRQMPAAAPPPMASTMPASYDPSMTNGMGMMGQGAQPAMPPPKLSSLRNIGKMLRGRQRRV